MIIEERLKELDSITLHRGSGGMDKPCLMNVVDYISGGDGSIDHPDCASRVITTFVIGINDAAVFAPYRDELMQYAARIVGTAGTPYQEQTRAYMLADWAVRTIAPMALDKAGLLKQTTDLRSLQPITDKETAIAAAAVAHAAYAAADAAVAVYDAANAAAAVAHAANAAAATSADLAAHAADTAAYDADVEAAYAVAHAAYAAADAAAAAAHAAYAAADAARAAAAFSTAGDERRALMDLSLEMIDTLIKVTE